MMTDPALHLKTVKRAQQDHRDIASRHRLATDQRPSRRRFGWLRRPVGTQSAAPPDVRPAGPSDPRPVGPPAGIGRLGRAGLGAG
jgi:hypothetical protein